MGITQRLGTIPLAIQTDASNNVGIGAAPSGSYKLEVTGTGRFSSTLLVSGASTFSSSVQAVSFVATGALTAGLIAANTSFIDNSSGTARFLSYGTNSSTRGAFSFIQASSINTLQNSCFSIDTTGLATFGSLTTGAVYASSGVLTNTAPSITATGGTITTSGGFKYHTFNSSGTFQVTAGSGLVEVFVLAGGGGGGGDFSGSTFYAGGGGAGGGVYNPAYYVEIASYTVTIGAGGVANSGSTGSGGDGGNSVFGNITAIGGGGGCRGNADSSNSNLGRNGGCGGGGGSNNSVAGTTTQSITNGVAYGNNGANGSGIGGGGGGIGTQPGQTGFGGFGKYVMNQANRIGGGGGSGTFSNGGVNAYDGGGRGGYWNGSNDSNSGGTAGTANTGGGGGGLGYPTGNGGAGGSGIVIVKYKA